MTSGLNSGHSEKDDHAHTRRRGAYVLTRIDKLTKDGKKIELGWNTKGQPIGEYASLFQHYISYNTRAKVSIGIPKWKAVPQAVKDQICQAVMDKFDIDQSKMKLVTLSAGKKWGDFKHILTKDYLYMKDKGQIRTQPPIEFPFIDKDSWAAFIQQRCTSEFQEISERNAEFAKQNKYPFKRSRKSYALIEEDLLRAEGLDPTNTSLPRYDLWMAGRKPYGEYDGNVFSVVQNIGSLKEQVSLGQISPTGTEDILSLALGKEDHSGRIRGVGAGVGVKNYFHESKRRSSSIASEIRINELQAKLEVLQQENASRDQLMEQLKTSLELLQKKWMETNGEVPKVQASVPSSDNVTSSKTLFSSSQVPKETWEECDLFWPDLSSKVAKGKVMIPSPGTVIMHHCQPLESDKCKILIEDALMPDFSLPFPTDEVTSVLQAKSSPVLWPKKLVVSLEINPSRRQKSALNLRASTSKRYPTKKRSKTVSTRPQVGCSRPTRSAKKK